MRLHTELSSLAAAVLFATACTSPLRVDTSALGTTPGASGSATAPAASISRSSSPSASPPLSPSQVGSTPPSLSPTSPPPCPSAYSAPDPRRPVTRLHFDVAAGLHSVTGTESIDFTADADITELVFRLTANTAPTFASGTHITVTSARADHGGGTARYDRAGAAAASQGGLLRIPFATRIAAGTTVHAQLAFRLELGAGAFDRFGYSDGVGWFGSAQPLLAWERGYGWHTEPMLQFTAESATSEAADTDLTVTAPAGNVVMMSGRPLRGTAVGAGRRSWHATIAVARDVSVAVGPFKTRDVRIGRTAVRVGALRAADLAAIVTDERFALAGLERYFGPFPFPTLSLTLLPGNGGGIEYPSSIFLLGDYHLVNVHETAHQYFYAMVGDSQAQHAWLDEAFASYAEQLLDNDAPPAAKLDLPDPVDKPTASYGGAELRYYATTYEKGAAALHAARSAAGPTKFDAAIRCYVRTEAWRVAEPGDLQKALSALPAAIAVLVRARALR